MVRNVLACLVVIVVSPASALAQTDGPRFQLGVQFATATSSEFDSTDIGVSGRLSWSPSTLLGVEAEIGFYPSDFADEPAFSRSRMEGLFGVTAGPRLGQLRPFAKLRSGFVDLSNAPRPFACILIFPPPLACRLAGGDTLFALDVGGGLELLLNDRTFARFDLSDRAVRYPGPVITGGSVRNESFYGHDLRVSVGGGVRF